MKRMLFVATTVAVFLVSGNLVATAALGPVVVHDNWSSRQIRGTHWEGLLPFSGADTGLESGRAVVVSATGVPSLVMNLTQRSDGTDAPRFALNLLGIPPSLEVAFLEATFRVMTASAKVGCSGTGFAEASALMALVPFADGTPKASPGDRTGDHLAVLGVGRNTEMTDSARILHVFVFLGRCEDADCDSFDNIGEVMLGTARRGSRVRASLTWVPEDDTIQARLGNDTPVDLSYGDGTMVESPPGRRIAAIGEVATTDHCATGTSAVVKTSFGTIKTAPLE